MGAPEVTVVVPYHRARQENGMLDTALWSLSKQTVPVAVITVDGTGTGAAQARTAGLMSVETEWAAFLDSDDWAYPEHIRTLLDGARLYKADLTYSYFTVHDQWEGARTDLDPLGQFGQPWSPALPTQTTTTILVRTELAQRVGGFHEQPRERMIASSPHLRYGEDLDFAIRCHDVGARIVHIPRRTWAWRIGTHNTSGLPGRGDAAERTDTDGDSH